MCSLESRGDYDQGSKDNEASPSAARGCSPINHTTAGLAAATALQDYKAKAKALRAREFELERFCRVFKEKGYELWDGDPEPGGRPKQRVWGEYIDSRSGEMFYFLPDKGGSQWDKPDMPPPPSTALVLDDLHEDDIVLFRFPGFHTDVHATVAKVRGSARRAGT